MSILKYTMNFFNAAYLTVKCGVGRTLRETGLQLDQIGATHVKDIAHLQPMNRHRNIMSLYNKIPAISPSAYIAPNATVYGDVFIGRDSYFGFGSIARGDINAVRVGINTKVGQNTILQTTHWGPDQAFPLSTNVGNNVTIQNNCLLFSCLVDDNVHIGHRSVILEGAQLERGCVIGPNSTVLAGSRIPANTLWAGNPVQFVKNLDTPAEERITNEEKQQIRLMEQ